MGWVWLPRAESVPWAGGGAPGGIECFPALGAAGASCTGCGTTARVDEGARGHHTRMASPLGAVLGGGGNVGRKLQWMHDLCRLWVAKL